MDHPDRLQAGDDALLGPPGVRRRLAELPALSINFDPEAIDAAALPRGWRLTDICQTLPAEPPGPPVPGGSFEIARRLMRGYHFADPSIVRAFYDPAVPLAQRNMLLKLQAFGVLHLWAPVRVVDVFEREERHAGGPVHIWGWSYCTLEGHVERGQMDWQVWKWAQSGEVQFRVHSVSATADISNPVIRLGFHLIKGYERTAFLQSTKRRMRTFVELALAHEQGFGGPIRAAAASLTAHRSPVDQSPHDELVRLVNGSEDA